MSHAHSKTARQAALEACHQLVSHGLSLNELLEQQLKTLDSERERAFCSELCYGFCRYFYILQESLKGLMKKPLKHRDQDIQVIILLGLYQIRFMRVEDHAAVNESVKLLKRRHKVWAKGLVNAVLRSYIRSLPERESVQSTLETQQLLTDEEHHRAYPQWISQKIKEDWSDNAAKVLQAGNERAPMVLRVDLQQVSRVDYMQQLTDVSISSKQHPVVEQALILDNPVAVERLPGFASGMVSVQDAAAQLAAVILDCKPGMRVLDACAAPGGKTLHLLQSAQDLQLVALDKDEERLQRVTQNLQRAGLDAELSCADAAQTQSWDNGQQFDRILLDAPCSASGIIRRHPDIRILRKATDVSGLVEQQKRLLTSLWPLLKPGGRLLYSTCSIFKDENERQIEHFKSVTDNCVEVPLKSVQWGQPGPSGRQILPGFSYMDGFYYALLEKV